MTQLTSRITNALLPRHLSNQAGAATRLSDLAALTKLRLSSMVVLTGGIGFAIGAKRVGLNGWPWVDMIATLGGLTLSCMGAIVFNQVYERRTDALMSRTQDRPLPAGRMTLAQAVLWGIALCGAGTLLLVIGSNQLTVLLNLFTIGSYALVYTPMKRLTSLSTVIGAVPGALPPVMGYTAVTGAWGPEAWLLFGILFLWQLPHFLAIAWLYRDQYARAGMAMLPVIDPTGASTFRQIFLGCLALIPLSLLPTMWGVTGLVYFYTVLAAGVAFLAFGLALIVTRSPRCARAMFLASLVYLPLVYALMLIDYAPAG